MIVKRDDHGLRDSREHRSRTLRALAGELQVLQAEAAAREGGDALLGKLPTEELEVLEVNPVLLLPEGPLALDAKLRTAGGA